MFVFAFLIKGDLMVFDRVVIGVFLSLISLIIHKTLITKWKSNSNLFSSFGWGDNTSNIQQTASFENKKNNNKSHLCKNNKQNNYSKPKSTIIADGGIYKAEGGNVVIQNGKIYVDGKLINNKKVKTNNITIKCKKSY